MENGTTVVGQSVDELLLAVGVVCRAEHRTDVVPGHACNAVLGTIASASAFSIAIDVWHGSLSEVDASTAQSPL